MQAANVRCVGELFGSHAQVTRIERLEAEVRELRSIVEALSAKGSHSLNGLKPRETDVPICTHKDSNREWARVRVSNR